MNNTKGRTYGDKRTQAFSEKYKSASGALSTEISAELASGGVGKSRQKMNKQMGIDNPNEEYPQ